MKKTTLTKAVNSIVTTAFVMLGLGLCSGCDLGTYDKRLKEHRAGEKPVLEASSEPTTESDDKDSTEE